MDESCFRQSTDWMRRLVDLHARLDKIRRRWRDRQFLVNLNPLQPGTVNNHVMAFCLPTHLPIYQAQVDIAINSIIRSNLCGGFLTAVRQVSATELQIPSSAHKQERLATRISKDSIASVQRPWYASQAFSRSMNYDEPRIRGLTKGLVIGARRRVRFCRWNE